MSKKEFDVLVVGELNVDLILNSLESFPEKGKEKIAGKMDLTIGSSSAIFACNLSTLGAKVAFLGKVGADSFGDLVLNELTKKGVDISMVIRDKDLKTGATIILNFNEDRAMVTHPGAMSCLTIKDITEAKLNKAAHLHFSSYYLQPGIKNNAAEMFKLAKELGLTTSFDMQWDPAEEWDMDYRKILPHVDIFLPNEQEILALANETDKERALKKISLFCNTIVVKMGNNGSMLWDKNSSNFLKPFLNKNIVDAIGAGDSFNAGFIFKYLQNKSLSECQEFGNLMGAINTTAAGGTGAFNSYHQIIKTAKEKFGYTGSN